MRAPPAKILLATDGSAGAATATRAAADLCRGLGSELHVVHAWTNALSEAYPALALDAHSAVFEREARALLKNQAEEARHAGASVSGTHLRQGRAPEEIVGLAEDLEVGLVVVGGRGAGEIGRLLSESVSEGVILRSTVPVLTVRGGEEVWPPSRLIVCDDGSEAAARAGNLAANVGRLFDAQAILVRVHPPESGFKAARITYDVGIPEETSKGGDEDLRHRADELEQILGKSPEIRTPTGAATGAILEVAEEDGEAPLVAMGRLGPSPAYRLAAGSVSADVLRSVAAPVLVVSSNAGR